MIHEMSLGGFPDFSWKIPANGGKHEKRLREVPSYSQGVAAGCTSDAARNRPAHSIRAMGEAAHLESPVAASSARRGGDRRGGTLGETGGHTYSHAQTRSGLQGIAGSRHGYGAAAPRQGRRAQPLGSTVV
jgi:hypothetical protein